MAGFFENVGKLVTEKSKQAVNKASDLTELASIKNEVSSLEKEIRNNYEWIGKRYYEVDGKDPHELFKKQCDDITSMQERIAELGRLAESIKKRSASSESQEEAEASGVAKDGAWFESQQNNDFS